MSARRAPRRAAGRPPGDDRPAYARSEVKRLLEAVLFASDRPVSTADLSRLLDGTPEAEIRAALEEMGREYEETGRSFILKEVAGGFLLYTHPAFEPWVRKLFRGRLTLRLSRSALETVALVAYRQPISKQELEIIRGVSVDGVLHTLLERRLIKVVGRKEGMGRALLYGTTAEFLQYMGLKDLSELPQLEEMQAILEAQEGGVPAVPPANNGPAEPPLRPAAEAKSVPAPAEPAPEAGAGTPAAEDRKPGTAGERGGPDEGEEDDAGGEDDDEDDDDEDDEDDENAD